VTRQVSRARPVAFALLAGLFALVSSGTLTGQSLTRARLSAVPWAAHSGVLALSAAADAPIATVVALQLPNPSDDDNPWGFFSKNVMLANSLSKWLALIFFTTILTYLYFPRLVFGIVVVVAGLALVKPQVRHSRLVRSGLVLFLVGWAALVVAGRVNDNPLGVGFLFAFTRPVAAAMMVLGATRALLKRTDKRLDGDITALVTSAEKLRPVWPDDPPLPEVDRVAAHRFRAGSALVMLLGAELDDSPGAIPRSVHVEQQAALALCRIYNVRPTAGETVSDARSTAQENSGVRGFWRRKVSATA